MIIKPADLLLVRGDDFIGKEIEIITHSIYSHVALFVDDTRLIEAQGFRRIGFQDPKVYIGKADIYRCYWLTDFQREAIVDHAMEQIGHRYDYLLIAVEALRLLAGIALPFYEYRNRICSTLVSSSYREEKEDPTPGILFPTPGELVAGPAAIFRKVGTLSGPSN